VGYSVLPKYTAFFRFQFTRMTTPSSLVLFTAIRHCTNLRSLRDIPLRLNATKRPNIWQLNLLPILVRISSPRLHDINFVVNVVRECDIDTFEWDVLTETLLRPQFSSLQRIRILLKGAGPATSSIRFHLITS
jgi:hypothetical protein